MIQKGTQEYKKAQEIARMLESDAAIDRWNANSRWDRTADEMGAFLMKIIALPTFAAKVAETVNGSICKTSARLASISGKQAWVIACAAVENNIEYNA